MTKITPIKYLTWTKLSKRMDKIDKIKHELIENKGLKVELDFIAEKLEFKYNHIINGIIQDIFDSHINFVSFNGIKFLININNINKIEKL